MRTWTKLTHKVIETDLSPSRDAATIEFTESVVTKPLFIFFWIKPEIRSEVIYREKYIEGDAWPGHWRSYDYKYAYYRVRDLKHIDDISYPKNPESYTGPQFGFHILKRIFADARNAVAQKRVMKSLEGRSMEV